MRIHYIQHAPFETPGVILDWAAENGHSLTRSLMCSGERAENAFPSLDAFDWLLIMGGPMNVYEEALYPWLAEEKVFIKRAVEAGKTALGFCLGAQLLAAALGGKVTRNPVKEIGWFPVRLTRQGRELPLLSFLPDEFVVFQWHGDTFSSLPPGALALAESDACKNQGFAYNGRVFAFQFHWENTRAAISDFIAAGRDELVPGEYIQSPEELLGQPQRIRQNNIWMREFLSRLASLEDTDEAGKQIPRTPEC
jgi:GMP synthase-like glutamine amidotransferase